MELVHGITGMHSFADDEDALVGRFPKCLIHISNHQFLIFYKAMHSLPYHAEPFLDGFLERAADGHHFAHRLHAAAQHPIYAMKLPEVPTGNLANHIVECRFEEGGSGMGDSILQVEQSVTQR